jgi:hypothetical protein
MRFTFLSMNGLLWRIGNSSSSQMGVPQRRGEAPRASSSGWASSSPPNHPQPTTIKNPGPYRALLYEFCLTPCFGRGNGSEKHGNSPGTDQGFPLEIREVTGSYVTIASARMNLASAKP